MAAWALSVTGALVPMDAIAWRSHIGELAERCVQAMRLESRLLVTVSINIMFSPDRTFPLTRHSTKQGAVSLLLSLENIHGLEPQISSIVLETLLPVLCDASGRYT